MFRARELQIGAQAGFNVNILSSIRCEEPRNDTQPTHNPPGDIVRILEYNRGDQNLQGAPSAEEPR